MRVPQQPGVLLTARRPAEEAALERLAADVRAEHPLRAVGTAFLETDPPTVFEGLRRLARECARVAVIPAFPGPGGVIPPALDAALAVAATCLPATRIRVAPPLGAEPELLPLARRCLTEMGATTSGDPGHTGIVVLGRGSRDPDALAPLVALAWRLGRDLGAARADGAFQRAAPPSLETVIADQMATGVRRILVFPHALLPDALRDHARDRIAGIRMRHPGLEVGLCEPPGSCPDVRAWIARRLETVETTPFHAGDPPWSS
ncbi:MAG: sirohydrochlorin chelatase [Thiohalospira sp.]|uniref:sirohydrochlorin chelatase n=1 Tax=Thiohalorhabdus sp. TaxID=3094134 RepID=UPI003980648F